MTKKTKNPQRRDNGFKVGDHIRLQWLADNLHSMTRDEQEYWTTAFAALTATVVQILADERVIVENNAGGNSLSTDAWMIERV